MEPHNKEQKEQKEENHQKLCKNLIDNLQHLINSFVFPETVDDIPIIHKNLSDKEEEDLFESITILISELIENDMMRYTSPKFHESVVEEIEELLEEQFKFLYDKHDNINGINNLFPNNIENNNIQNENDNDNDNDNENDNDNSIVLDIREEIHEIIQKAMNLFYRHIAPERSSGDTFIRIKPNKEILRKKIEYLRSIPQPEQRTNEWYLFRHKFLTASSIWKAFGSQSSQNQLIHDKCKPINIDKYKAVSIDSAMHWGNKYEPVSISIYEQKYNTTISDFGCIPHKNITFIAASPDGINTLDTSDRYGRMLEVKNIVNREINGIPKTEYWIQMQMQMEVCNLNECDFLETRFTEYEEYDDFQKDGDLFNISDDGQPKGIIIYFIKEGQPFYEYMPLTISTNEEFNQWEEMIMEKYSDLSWMKNMYWKLNEISCVLILRNKAWFKAAEPIVTELWNTIQQEKVNGYDHRAPNKRSISNKFNKYNENNNEKKCLIDVKQLFSISNENENDIINTEIINTENINTEII